MNLTPPEQVRPLTVFVEGIGVLGAGLSHWDQARDVLSGVTAYVPQRCILPLPDTLPAAERRRAGAVVKASLAVAGAAVAASGLSASDLPSVFTSSSGDALNCHEICKALASNDRLISPTRFHNSVHNASSGYWSISSGSMASSSVLCGHDASFSAGLLEAMAQVVIENKPVLLVAYDTDYPEPLHSVRPLPDSFGAALVLSPRRSANSLAEWRVSPASCFNPSEADTLSSPLLEQLRLATPAARCLPLLHSIATRQSAMITLDYLQGIPLAVHVNPC